MPIPPAAVGGIRMRISVDRNIKIWYPITICIEEKVLLFARFREHPVGERVRGNCKWSSRSLLSELQ